MHDADNSLFRSFFQGQAKELLLNSIKTALQEDARDLTSLPIFPRDHLTEAAVICKEKSIMVGLPLIPMILTQVHATPSLSDKPADTTWSWKAQTEEGAQVQPGVIVATIQAATRLVLEAERVILNFITHLSGIANLTARYVEKMNAIQADAPKKSRLLDTRKTLPGLRYPEKYAVRLGGGYNHRLNLEEMLMLKNNHVDAAGSITRAVAMLRQAYQPCPPIEVECRTLEEVQEAVANKVERIMLDNMTPPLAKKSLALIPPSIESELSGGVSLDNMSALEKLLPFAPDFVSVGRLTHSAPAADFNLRIIKK